MDHDQSLERGRAAFEREAWGEAYRELSAARDRAALEPEDLERLATAAYLVGEEADSTQAWERAHHEFLERDRHDRAVRAAFWLGFHAMIRGEMAHANGWLSRAQRLCEELGLDCVERGYLNVPAALISMGSGDNERAYAAFDEAGRIARRFGDHGLEAFSLLGRGQALLRQGRTSEAVALFDEAMVSVTGDVVPPLHTGIVYCAVIDECQEAFDVGRAQEWTTALDRWCNAHPEMVPYRGQCLVHRSQLLQLHGDWAGAMREAQHARDRLSEPRHPAIGEAHYQLGELHRIRGEFDEAADAYQRAHDAGRRPHPGMALLHLARSRLADARAAIEGALDEALAHQVRSRLLPAAIEILLGAGRTADARRAADELTAIAGAFDVPLLSALAATSEGAVLIAEGEPKRALEQLRVAADTWRGMDAPYEHARARVLTATAARALGDTATADLELDAARRTFERLGAASALANLNGDARASTSGLTPREVEVLRSVAAGKRNREIAGELVISEKTVERHLSNIFTKLGLSSRAAATAYAYEHDLV